MTYDFVQHLQRLQLLRLLLRLVQLHLVLGMPTFGSLHKHKIY